MSESPPQWRWENRPASNRGRPVSVPPSGFGESVRHPENEVPMRSTRAAAGLSAAILVLSLTPVMASADAVPALQNEVITPGEPEYPADFFGDGGGSIWLPALNGAVWHANGSLVEGSEDFWPSTTPVAPEEVVTVTAVAEDGY